MCNYVAGHLTYFITSNLLYWLSLRWLFVYFGSILLLLSFCSRCVRLLFGPFRSGICFPFRWLGSLDLIFVWTLLWRLTGAWCWSWRRWLAFSGVYSPRASRSYHFCDSTTLAWSELNRAFGLWVGHCTRAFQPWKSELVSPFESFRLVCFRSRLPARRAAFLAPAASISFASYSWASFAVSHGNRSL